MDDADVQVRTHEARAYDEKWGDRRNNNAVEIVNHKRPAEPARGTVEIQIRQATANSLSIAFTILSRFCEMAPPWHISVC
jgi:hypothetical protein